MQRPIGEDGAGQISRAFNEPLSYSMVRTADLHDDAGFCARCGVAYCYTHWNTSTIGYGYCPKGHGKPLDPHWSPDSLPARCRRLHRPAAVIAADPRCVCRDSLPFRSAAGRC